MLYAARAQVQRKVTSSVSSSPNSNKREIKTPPPLSTVESTSSDESAPSDNNNKKTTSSSSALPFLSKASTIVQSAEAGLSTLATSHGGLFDYHIKTKLEEIKEKAQKSTALLNGGVDAVNNTALFDEGVNYFSAGQYDKALPIFEALASKEQGEAHYYLGYMYVKGWGVKVNPEKILHHLTTAAQLQSVNAMCMMGRLVYEGKYLSRNVEQAKDWYKEAIKRGSIEAQNLLGHIYLVEKEYALALKYFEAVRGIEADNMYTACARYNIGCMFLHGWGMEKDEEGAKNLFEHAAKQGLPEGYIALSELYRNGWGVEQDDDKALLCLADATHFKHPDAYYEIANRYYQGVGGEQNLDAAFQCYEWAADMGHPEAKYMLGACYAEGWGVEKNNDTAYKHWEKAAQLGSLSAQLDLGDRFYYGVGGCHDYKKALMYYKQAVAQGSHEACNHIGHIYLNGCGVKPNYDLALMYYRLANEMGSDVAQGYCDYVKKLKPVELREEERVVAQQEAAGVLHHIANIYLLGQGVKQDRERGFVVCALAAKAGSAAANVTMGHQSRVSAKTKKEYEVAVGYYKRAIQLGWVEKTYSSLGKMVKEGHYRLSDYRKNLQTLKKQADQGMADACKELALIYREGLGVPPRIDEARHFEEKYQALSKEKVDE